MSKILSFEIPEDELDALKDAATLEKRSLSDYITRNVLKVELGDTGVKGKKKKKKKKA